MRDQLVGICVLTAAILRGNARADQRYYITDRGAGIIWRLEDLNGDQDALDGGEKLLWSQGHAGPVELTTDGPSVYVVQEGSADGANTIVRLHDANADGDALDFGESSNWAVGLHDPRAIARTLSDVFYVAELTLNQVWRFEDLNGDGDGLDPDEASLFANVDNPMGILVRQGDILVTQHVSGTVVRLVDANADGDALDELEQFEPTPHVYEPLGLLLGDSPASFYLGSRGGNAILCLRDMNRDGDYFDVAELRLFADSVFGGLSQPWGLAASPGGGGGGGGGGNGGGLMLANSASGQVLRARDVNGDGDALDIAEVLLFAEGFVEPTGVLASDIDGDLAIDSMDNCPDAFN